jgi:hypothetical protein
MQSQTVLAPAVHQFKHKEMGGKTVSRMLRVHYRNHQHTNTATRFVHVRKYQHHRFLDAPAFMTTSHCAGTSSPLNHANCNGTVV